MKCQEMYLHSPLSWKYLVSLAAILFGAQSAFASSLTLAWDPSPDSGAVANYRLHYGSVSGAYSFVTNAGPATTLTIQGLAEGTTYYFAATAVGTNQLESDFSNEISYSVPVPSNTPPTISFISNQTINEDETAGPIGFTVGDAQSSADGLTLNGSSSNTGLVPDGNIVFEGGGASRTVTVTPLANASGSAQITVNVSDGELSASRVFSLTVNPVNDAPTLDDLSNMTVVQAEGEPGLNLGVMGAGTTIWAVAPGGAAQTETVNLTGISSGGESSQTLSVTASSSDPSLIPDPTVTYSSPSSSGSLTFTPAVGATGSAELTVTVRDNGGGSDTVQESFTVNVSGPANLAPTLTSISSQSMNEDGVLGPVSFTVNDAQTPAESLVVTAISKDSTLIPSSGLQLGGSGSSRNLTLSPAADRWGKTLVTLTASDAQGAMAIRSFWVNVAAVNDAPTLNAPADVTLAGAQIETVSLGGIDVGPLDGVQRLTVQAFSSNPSLIPHPEVVYYSPNATAELQLAPVQGASGSATITVTVEDDGGTANGGEDTISRTFSVTTAPQVAMASAPEPTGQGSAVAAMTVPRPRLQIGVQGGLIVLSWDGAGGPYVLECSRKADPQGEWAKVKVEPEAVAGSRLRVLIQPRGSSEFYRLARQ